LELKVEDEEKTAPASISSNGFYGTKAANQGPQFNNDPYQKRPPSSTSSHATIYPIEAISPYSHKWTIKARCTTKSAVKTWHNSKSEGRLFSVNLLDDSGEIRATGFNDQCDMLYDLFQEGSVYYISSPCRVQIAKKQFSNVNNDYELTFERDTIVEKVRTGRYSNLNLSLTTVEGRRSQRCAADPIQLHQHRRPAVCREGYDYRCHWIAKGGWPTIASDFQDNKEAL
jgi:hypothetical protein